PRSRLVARELPTSGRRHAPRRSELSRSTARTESALPVSLHESSGRDPRCRRAGTKPRRMASARALPGQLDLRAGLSHYAGSKSRRSPPDDPRDGLRSRERTRRRRGLRPRGWRRFQPRPATVILAILTVGDETFDRNARSLPIASIPANISWRFPAIVTSSTGNVSLPSSIHRPAAPRE